MLIPSKRHTREDLLYWASCERLDRIHATSGTLAYRVKTAIQAIELFGFDDTYVGVSWGKDSVVMSHLVLQVFPRIPVVWVRVDPIDNPHCPLVRDVFLQQHPDCNYHEVRTQVQWDGDQRQGTGVLKEGFRIAAETYGSCYFSGVRSDESRTRKLRYTRWGESTPNTCAPLSRWTGEDVYGYLYQQNLPVHPAYAMTVGGLLDRNRIRVASIGGERGTGMGRREWEERYYKEELHAIQAGKAPAIRNL